MTSTQAVGYGHIDNTRSSFGHTIFPFSDAPAPKKISARFNFISFLAVSQRLEVPLLHVTWDPSRQLVGAGHSGQIAEAPLSLESSFAFKRIGSDDKIDDAGAEIFHPLINEVAILRHQHIEGHPNVPELEGVCWDITPSKGSSSSGTVTTGRVNEFNVWPVLVFEKSQYGDLYQFSQSPEGRELTLSDRLKICMDVGNAVAVLQTNHIIHGDVKPQNVLVYASQQPGVLSMAKLIDFGFASWCGDANDRVTLPRSWPWYAPECDEYPQLTPLEGQKTDRTTYSRALEGANSPLEILASLKSHQLLPRLAYELVAEEPSIQARSKQMLQQFFSGSLAYDSTSRHPNMKAALAHLDIEEARRTSYPSANYLSYADRMRRQAGKRVDVIQMPPATDADFNICMSLHFLYSSDYRLRVHVARCLQEIVDSDPASTSLSHQLALCNRLGFGGMSTCQNNSSGKSDYPLGIGIDSAPDKEIQASLDYISSSGKDQFVIFGTFYALSEALRFNNDLPLVDIYRRDNVLEAAENAMRFELRHVENVLGPDHWITLLLMTDLASIVGAQKRDRDAEELEVDLVHRSSRAFGRRHGDTLDCMSRLVWRYMRDGRLKQAEELALEVVNTRVELYSKHDPISIARASDLGWIYVHQGRLKEAEDVFAELVALDDSEPGTEFPSTLKSMEDLAFVYERQHRFQEAEHVLLRVISGRQKVFGREDPGTLATLRSLESMYRQQGREDKADALLSGRRHGDPHFTVDSQRGAVLAATYNVAAISSVVRALVPQQYSAEEGLRR
ncbi:hypothetical protein DL764_008053 [Monosporascus ibericus]|uniref:Protein kinase domain-containing protein n=1 Tax=Monosporascus ibericus TaxID=155417 RepID=A0A4V1X9D4_9PEZI|nr:hypothetical protein DL764_008053 [Monosporascus ibericus]